MNDAASANPPDIVIGHVAGYSGLVSKDANDLGRGGNVYFAAVNAAGGVFGKKIRLIPADDHFVPEQTARLIASMATKASALLPTTGSANMTHVLQSGVLDHITLPIVGVVPGSESFRRSLHKNLFHLRAGDGEQLEKIVDHLTSVGITDIGMLVRSGSSGVEVATIIEESLRKRGLQPSVHAVYDLSSKEGFAPQVKLIKQKRPPALIIQGMPQGVVAATEALRQNDVDAMIFATSYADAGLLVKKLGSKSVHGVVISQVMPNLNKKTMPIIKQFYQHYTKYAGTSDEPSYFTLEGYISARLIVEAIKRSKDASPAGVIRGLEQMQLFDLGGYVVDFSPTNHNGSRWVELSIIDSHGRVAY